MSRYVSTHSNNPLRTVVQGQEITDVKYPRAKADLFPLSHLSKQLPDCGFRSKTKHRKKRGCPAKKLWGSCIMQVMIPLGFPSC